MLLSVTKCVLLICIYSVVFLRCAGILANNEILTTAKAQRLYALVQSSCENRPTGSVKHEISLVWPCQ